MMTFEVQQPERQSINLQRRILVVGRVSLLEEGIVQLIKDRHHVIIFHADDNPDDVDQKVIQTNPDVIILCHVEPNLVQNLTSRLNTLPGTPERIMINVDLGHTELRIYQFRRWFSASFSAFFPLACGGIANDLREHEMSM